MTEKTNPPGKGGVIHLGVYGTGYTGCRIFIPDLPEADRYWMSPPGARETASSQGDLLRKLAAQGPVTCPHCLTGRPAPLCSTDPSALRLWTIYERPRDYPESFVAREWSVNTGKPSPEAIVAPSLRECRAKLDDYLRRAGRGGLDMLYRMPRKPKDEPQIVETWV